jgi:hypothetical protein
MALCRDIKAGVEERMSEKGRKWDVSGRVVVCVEMGKNVRGLHDDSDPTRFDSFLNAEGDLFCKAFLHLETTAEGLCYACEFGYAQNELVWDIRYGNLEMDNGQERREWAKSPGLGVNLSRNGKWFHAGNEPCQ